MGDDHCSYWFGDKMDRVLRKIRDIPQIKGICGICYQEKNIMNVCNNPHDFKCCKFCIYQTHDEQ